METVFQDKSRYSYLTRSIQYSVILIFCIHYTISVPISAHALCYDNCRLLTFHCLFYNPRKLQAKFLRNPIVLCHRILVIHHHKCQWII